MLFNKGYKNITPQDGKKKMSENKDLVVIDVRSAAEHKESYIPGSVNMPLDLLEFQVDTKVKKKDQEVIVYCLSGGRSAMAAKLLVSKGYTNVLNMGGIMSWPFEKVSKK